MGLKRIAILAALLVALVRLDGREIAEGRDSALLLKSTVVEPEDLPALMADVRKNRIRLLDARLAQAYQAGHPRRATWVDEEAWRDVSITYASYTPEDPVPLIICRNGLSASAS